MTFKEYLRYSLKKTFNWMVTPGFLFVVSVMLVWLWVVGIAFVVATIVVFGPLFLLLLAPYAALGWFLFVLTGWFDHKDGTND